MSLSSARRIRISIRLTSARAFPVRARNRSRSSHAERPQLRQHRSRVVPLQGARDPYQHVVVVDFAALAFFAGKTPLDAGQEGLDDFGLQHALLFRVCSRALQRGGPLCWRAVEIAVEVRFPEKRLQVHDHAVAIGLVFAFEIPLEQRPGCCFARKTLAQFGAECVMKRAAAIHDAMTKRSAGFKREFAEHPLAEAVNGENRGGIEREQRILHRSQILSAEASLLVLLCIAGPDAPGKRRFEQRADAGAQLRGCLLGEGDDQDAVDRASFFEHQVEHQVLDCPGLTGSGAGFDQRVFCGLYLAHHRRPAVHDLIQPILLLRRFRSRDRSEP